MGWLKRERFHVFDPGKGQNWTTKFYDDSVFSSLHHQCVVLHITNHRYVFEQCLPAALILECLRNTGSVGLFTIAPSEYIDYYDVGRIPASIEHHNTGNSIVGHFDLTLENLEGLLHAMQVKDQYYYELNLASCLPGADLLSGDLPREVGYSFLLRNFDTLGALVSFDYDNLELILFVRLFDGWDGVIDAIAQTEQRPAR